MASSLGFANCYVDFLLTIPSLCAGKSTLLNAILGQEVLPVNNVPETARICKLRHLPSAACSEPYLCEGAEAEATTTGRTAQTPGIVTCANIYAETLECCLASLPSGSCLDLATPQSCTHAQPPRISSTQPPPSMRQTPLQQSVHSPCALQSSHSPPSPPRTPVWRTLDHTHPPTHSPPLPPPAGAANIRARLQALNQAVRSRERQLADEQLLQIYCPFSALAAEEGAAGAGEAGSAPRVFFLDTPGPNEAGEEGLKHQVGGRAGHAGMPPGQLLCCYGCCRTRAWHVCQSACSQRGCGLHCMPGCEPQASSCAGACAATILACSRAWSYTSSAT